ncbi:MAG TPA: hypothetical protein PLV52_03425, partial [Candidatus Omnitrophota bacterium]|nr:hypothetical protein [Candidatus Omnitrophota bacterium]
MLAATKGLGFFKDGGPDSNRRERQRRIVIANRPEDISRTVIARKPRMTFTVVIARRPKADEAISFS